MHVAPTIGTVLRFALAVVALAGVLLLSGCGGSSQGGARPSPGTVAELASVDELRDAFRADAGVTRLVVLLSPT